MLGRHSPQPRKYRAHTPGASMCQRAQYAFCAASRAWRRVWVFRPGSSGVHRSQISTVLSAWPSAQDQRHTRIAVQTPGHQRPRHLACLARQQHIPCRHGLELKHDAQDGANRRDERDQPCEHPPLWQRSRQWMGCAKRGETRKRPGEHCRIQDPHPSDPATECRMHPSAALHPG